MQQRAADVAYAVDERAGNNILALGVGVTVFWPALLAMRPAGLEAADLARLKGRYEALRTASVAKGCPPAAADLRARRRGQLAAWRVGDRLIYEDRAATRLPASPWVLRVTALRRARDASSNSNRHPAAVWRQDRSGNVLEAPAAHLQWQRLLRATWTLGQVVAGEMGVVGDPLARARLRGQVVAVGPQIVADRRFDAAVIELFGDAQYGEAFTRVDGRDRRRPRQRRAAAPGPAQRPPHLHAAAPPGGHGTRAALTHSSLPGAHTAVTTGAQDRSPS